MALSMKISAILIHLPPGEEIYLTKEAEFVTKLTVRTNKKQPAIP